MAVKRPIVITNTNSLSELPAGDTLDWNWLSSLPLNVEALEVATGTGFFATATGSGVGAMRQLSGPSSVKVTNADGIAGNPSFNLDGDVVSPGSMFSYATDQAGVKGWYRPALFESTGLLSWASPQLAINGSDPTKFDVGAAVVGYTDYSSNSVAPVRAFSTYGPSTGNSVPNLAVFATWVGIQTPGTTLVMQSTPFTATQRRSIVQLGAVISDGTQLIAVNIMPVIMRAGINQVSDFMSAVGPINKGNLISPNGANLQINKGAGTVFKEGSNFANNPNDPHNLQLPALTATNFNYRTSTGVQAATTNSINVTQYENPLGTLATVPNNRFTVQRIYVFASNLLRLQYGQHVYPTMADAEAFISTETFATETNIAENGVLLGFLIVKKNATALNDAAEAKFIPADKFGGIVGSGGTSITNTDALPEGSVNLYFTEPRTRSTLLSGLSVAINAAITAADSVLGAFGKLQAQITAVIASLANYVPIIRTISTTAPLTGGGDLSANRTLGISAATTGAAGSMSAADKTKLDGIAAGAQVNTVASVNTKTGVVVLNAADVGAEPTFSKGDLIAGTNISFSGSGVGRLVGGASLTINSSGGGGGVSKTLKEQRFTSSGTWIRPAGVDSVEVLMVGGGGGSGGRASNTVYNGGGGGGQVIRQIVPVTANVTVTIGAGGAGPSLGSTSGSQGGTTSFGTVNAYGGGGGGGGGAAAPPAPVNGGSGGGNAQNIFPLVPGVGENSSSGGPGGGGGAGGGANGTNGGNGLYGLGGGGGGGIGAGGYTGNSGANGGGPGGTVATAGIPNTGGGGGGGAGNVVGASGGSGICIVTWWE